MVVSLSPQRTVLWDQIRYSGDPQDFVWVLPVPTPDVKIEIADAQFFDDLEFGTQVQVSAPPLAPPPSCPPPPWGSGGFTLDAGASASDAGVEVFSEEVVGPYETVVIGSADANALVTWLNDHDYNVPASTIPTIQYYTDLNSEFIVLRLAPDQGVSAMQPIRIEFPGYMATFPLKMVTVGAYGKLAMTLWVFAEQRYEPKNYGSIEIAETQLIWDFSNAQSNYRQLFRNAIDAAGGKAWVTQYAQPASSLWISSPELGEATATIPNAFVTRLETDLLVDHLDADLVLGPASGDWVSRFLQAQSSLNPPPPPTCPDWDGNGIPDDLDQKRGNRIYGCSLGDGATGVGALLVLAVIAMAGAWRRRRAHAGSVNADA